MELELAKEYALRVKDVAAQEAQAATAAAHAQALQAEKRALADVRQEMETGQAAGDRLLQQANERHQVWKIQSVSFLQAHWSQSEI